MGSALFARSAKASSWVRGPGKRQHELQCVVSGPLVPFFSLVLQLKYAPCVYFSLVPGENKQQSPKPTGFSNLP